MKSNHRITVFIPILAILTCLLVKPAYEHRGGVYAVPYQAEVEDISDREYFMPTLNAINNAKESIVMGMYIISIPPGDKGDGVRRLLEKLVSAKKRGVYVKVIFEYHSAADLTPEGKSYLAYKYLKDNGIDVFFDEFSTKCLHLKTIVIDKEIVITGSSNWSEAAFKSSYETNLLVRSKGLAQKILNNLEKIPVKKEFIKDIKNSFPIPCSFISKWGALSRMVASNDERSFDIILLLWSENRDVISCALIAERLGLTNKMTREGWRRQIKKVFRKLQKRYNLIRYAWHHGKDNIETELISYPGDNPVKFPKDYFEYKWNTRLNLCAKAVLVTMYAELHEITDNVIKLPILYLSKKYQMKLDAYSKGIQELKRFNIIKVQYGKGFENRAITKITILGIYDMESYNKEIQGLKKLYGEEMVKEAQNLAGIVYCAYDIYVIKDILKQIELYGINAVREAFSYVKKMSVDNYKRTYNYTLGILRRRNTPAPLVETTKL